MPRKPSTSLNIPLRPKTITSPKTATITGSRKGAPSSVISAPRPLNCRRASARATGIASRQLIAAEAKAWDTVNCIAAQSAAPSPVWNSARKATAQSVPSVSANTSPATMPPGQRGFIATGLCAMRRVLSRGSQARHLQRRAMISRA